MKKLASFVALLAAASSFAVANAADLHVCSVVNQETGDAEVYELDLDVPSSMSFGAPSILFKVSGTNSNISPYFKGRKDNSASTDEKSVYTGQAYNQTGMSFTLTLDEELNGTFQTTGASLFIGDDLHVENYDVACD